MRNFTTCTFVSNESFCSDKSCVAIFAKAKKLSPQSPLYPSTTSKLHFSPLQLISVRLCFQIFLMLWYLIKGTNFFSSLIFTHTIPDMLQIMILMILMYHISSPIKLSRTSNYGKHTFKFITTKILEEIPTTSWKFNTRHTLLLKPLISFFSFSYKNIYICYFIPTLPYTLQILKWNDEIQIDHQLKSAQWVYQSFE